MDIKLKPEVNFVKLESQFSDIMDFEKHPDLGVQLHNALARYLNPYVPMQTGTLSQSTIISPDRVTYTQPYAHYQYSGIVYGPNIPVFENGMITGWFSPPGKGTKQPTGRPIHYSTELHPLATHHWEQAMMRDCGEAFTKEVGRIINRWLNTSG